MKLIKIIDEIIPGGKYFVEYQDSILYFDTGVIEFSIGLDTDEIQLLSIRNGCGDLKRVKIYLTFLQEIKKRLGKGDK